MGQYAKSFDNTATRDVSQACDCDWVAPPPAPRLRALLRKADPLSDMAASVPPRASNLRIIDSSASSFRVSPHTGALNTYVRGYGMRDAKPSNDIYHLW